MLTTPTTDTEARPGRSVVPERPDLVRARQGAGPQRRHAPSRTPPPLAPGPATIQRRLRPSQLPPASAGDPARGPGLPVSSPSDPAELEADRVAARVAGGAERVSVHRHDTAGRIQRCPGGCPTLPCDHEEPVVQRSASPGAPPPPVASGPLVGGALCSPGAPLDTGVRADMEARFGHDFSQVRVHTGSAAGRAAAALHASAFTVGHDIVFADREYRPASEPGRRLVAHELTHVVQQRGGATLIARQPSPVTPEVAVLRGKPQPLEPLSSSGPDFPFFQGLRSHDTELYFGQETDVCRSCHQAEEQGHFQMRKVEHAPVTESKIREWASRDAWGEAVIDRRSLTRKSLFSLLLRHEDKQLDAIWESYRGPTVAKVRPDPLEDLRRPVFIGSYAARNHWADYVDASWPEVVADLDRKAVDFLVREIEETLRTPVIPAGASLVTDPARVAAIEGKPGKEQIDLGRWGATSTIGFEWVGKRIKSAEEYRIAFEVIGHEGIYFDLSGSDFLKTDPFIGKVAGDVAKATKGAAALGGFIKGVLTAVASPVTMALDTAAKVIDMGSQGISALGKWRGWYDIGYTCLSSTCQQYDQCINSDQRPADCQSEALKAALEEATIIVPLYRQGRQCVVDGDPEACGAIAVMALGLVKLGGKPLAAAELEGASIRSAIERPRAGDPKFAGAFEPLEKAATREAKAPAAAEKAPAKPHAHKEPPAGRAEPAVTAAPHEPTIESFAKDHGVSPKQLSADLVELRRNARDPGKVRQPAEARFDAELSTSANGEPHTFDRERATPGHEGEPRIWCRRSPSAVCGVPVDPEVNKMVDEALQEHEGGTAAKPSSRPEKTLTAAEYKRVKAAAEEAFEHGDQPSQIGAGVARHKEASAIRQAEGVSGKQVQSAHVTPSSYLKTLDDYSRDNAITMHLGREEHASFDEVWKDWSKKQRQLGHEKVTVQELHDVMADAIERAPITDAQKSALFTLLHDELFQKHGLSRTSELPLAYPNWAALKPGPELTALKATVAAERKAQAASRAKAVARERAHAQKEIESYERTARSLERSGRKGEAQVYWLQIEKLKKRRK